MKKKIISYLCVLTLLLSFINFVYADGVEIPNNSKAVYEKVNEIDLRDIDFKLNNNELILTSKNNQTSTTNDTNLSGFKELLKDDTYKKSIIETIKKGYKPIRVASKTVYVESSYDPQTNKTTDKLLSNAEVAALNSSPELAGTIQPMATSGSYVKGRLTISGFKSI